MKETRGKDGKGGGGKGERKVSGWVRRKMVSYRRSGGIEKVG